jgi:hypothetical protein
LGLDFHLLKIAGEYLKLRGKYNVKQTSVKQGSVSRKTKFPKFPRHLFMEFLSVVDWPIKNNTAISSQRFVSLAATRWALL